jgi:alpha-beta hydrolase superfamily lysophospholipase
VSPSAKPDIQWLQLGDETALACRRWLGTEGQAVILYLHGIEGHGEWFEHTGSLLHEHGFSVYVPDRRGAGLNSHQRGHLSSFKLFLADIEHLLHHMQSQHPASPIVLFGNCWGAKAAAVIGAKNYKPVTGASLPEIATIILTCPALFTKVDFSLGTKAGIGCDVIFGGERQMREIAIPISVEMFTDNRDFIKYIQADQLRLKAATSRFYFENFLLSLKARFAAKRIKVPLLLVQTDNDQIVDLKKVEDWFEKVGSQQKTMRVFANASHSIDFDQRCFAEYVSLLVDWLNSKAVTA